ncbi:YqgE/AlgH family protein [Streptomyces sp. NPDC018031]|uniref:YqgE/AlgH family protein n=1 Tax=Streptomyces sp. NPDC018031 TaxID=3365033 RepID=UPI00378C1A77
MTEVSSLTGRLLVATPALADPNFDRAVVLLLDHDEEGSLGVVLNRPTPVGVGDILESWASLAGEPAVVFQGGPVSLDSALGVAVVPGEAERAERAERMERTDRADRPGGTPAIAGGGPGPGSRLGPGGGDPIGWRRVHGAIGLVDLEAPPELLAAAVGSLRIFAGYAGWGPGQLEEELSEGAWYVVESEPGDVSSPDPERLWRSVLRRQRSELAMVATYPDDPSLN